MTELFPRPIWCDWQFSGEIGETYTLLYGPGHATSPVTNAKQVVVAGDITTNPPGSYMIFNVSGVPSFDTVNQIYSVVFTNNTSGGYTTVTFVDNVPLTTTTGSLMSQATGGYVIWEQEFGSNKITAVQEYAIDSFVKTSDISFIGGTPAEDHMVTANRRMHITRVEPDFKQTGDMTLTIVGRPFAQSSNVENSGPYSFSPDTGKIDLRVEYRLISLIFESNVIDGDYEAGRIMITAEMGDERP
jgi:hypothetical protein